ncbi:hypothetical protein PT974_01282 [Cladobotryum mycophilum]|uniref:Uncharacterized protein n=1 Tax=Cladobotryum mycophilum TaxID=491253 RepID=A0ABR0T382_9HYPO
MAPLGIAAIIVSAIRVGHLPLLKAIRLVCELWNSRNIVRCEGSATIWEFIFLLPEGTSSASAEESRPLIKMMRLSDASHKREWPPPSRSTRSPFRRRTSQPASHDTEVEDSGTAITEKATEEISSNARGAISRLGFEYLRRRYQKRAAGQQNLPDEEQGDSIRTRSPDVVEEAGNCEELPSQQGYNLKGLIFVVCDTDASALDLSLNTHTKTEQGEIYQLAFFGIMLQPCSKIYTGKEYDLITTSRQASKEKKTSGEDQDEFGGLGLEIKTWIRTIVSISGFLLQFIGLRGMHWSASVVRLRSVIFMIVLRAGVRRGLARPFKVVDITPKFEIDWLAMCMGSPKHAAFFQNLAYDSLEGCHRSSVSDGMSVL